MHFHKHFTLSEGYGGCRYQLARSECPGPPLPITPHSERSFSLVVGAVGQSTMAEEILRAWATPALQKDYGSDPVLSNMLNDTMSELQCCGFTNYTDFVGSHFAGNLPPTCCLADVFPCSQDEAKESSVEGCFQQILKLLKENANIVGGIAAGIGVLEITAMVVSMYLYCHLNKRVS
ncbi:tetraspanin-1-like [Entelurus aequoreus]|uniref:tetraspanin-1-like n=1 Tax=Entelurus aequoreus TaxID=161455 RepID=UPI002B1DF1EA|nr:tetraspanin-1-like [Entelurus aequoreus]